MKSLTPTYDRFVHKVDIYRRKEKRLSLYSGLLKSLTIITVGFSLSVILEDHFKLSPLGRSIILVLFIVVSLASVVYFILPPLHRILLRRNTPSLAKTALRIGVYYENVNDRLVNALQLFEKHQHNPENYSLALVDDALQKVDDILEHEDFNSKIDRRPFKKAARGFGCIITAAAVIWLIFAPSFLSAVYRFSQPGRDFSYDPAAVFQVTPGDIQILKGQDVHLSAWVSDNSVSAVNLQLLQSDEPRTIDLKRSEKDSFDYALKNVTEPFSYKFSFKKLNSQRYKVSVIERPLLKNLSVKVTPPRYSGLKGFYLGNNIGDVTALKGSTIQLSGEANKPLSQGKIDFEKSQDQDLKIIDNRVAADFALMRDDNYSLYLKDASGYESENPIEYHLRVIADQVPFVRIISPGKDIDLGEDMHLPLLFEAEDDFGLSMAQLGYQLLPEGKGEADSSGFQFQPVTDFRAGSEKVRHLVDWDLSSMDMLPKDVMVYFIEVFDNDEVSGPKRSRSQLFRARFPSIYELYEEVAYSQDEAIEKLESAYEKSVKLKDKIDKLSLELRRADEIDWQQQQEVSDAVQNQKSLQEELQKTSDVLDQMIEKMEKNQLASAETLNKYKELQQLIKEIMTPELQEAMEKIAEAMQNLDQQKLQQALQQLNLSEEEINKNLDRTISLLKKIKLEQMLDKSIRMTQELQERQQKIQNDLSDKAKSKDDLVKEQENIHRDSESLKESLDDILERMLQEPGMPEQQIEEAVAQLDSANSQQKQNDRMNALQHGTQSQIQQESLQFQQSLNNISQQLTTAKDMLTGAMNQKILQAMRQSTRNLLELSKEQEALWNETKDLPRNSALSPDIAERQKDLSSALSREMNKLYEAAKQSLAISSTVGASLGSASQKMDGAMESLQERNNIKASSQQGEAMAALNESVKKLQSSMQNMLQGSSGAMSYEQYLQRMQQMAGMQQGINEQTLGLGLGQQMTLEQQAALSRLAAQQNAVRKSMEQLAQEAAGASENMGSLDKIAEDMKGVEKDLANHNISRETIQRQNQILSRMLDYQKSIREREYSNKRKAETGKEYVTQSPADLPEDLGERSSQLMQDLLRAQKEGYSRDYLELIKNYFEAVTEYENRK
jgi:hypothetical protein